MSSYEQLISKLEKAQPSYYVAVVPYCPMLDAVLLGHRREDGIWTTPAGGANSSETPEDCAVRECWEEAQLEVDKDELIPICVKTAPNGKPVHCYAFVTHQMEFSISSDPDREVPEWKWHPVKDLPAGLSRQKNQNRLETINEALMCLKGLKKSKGEGSRGGKVIGRTKSGRPIYAGKKAHEYTPEGATADDHHEAAQHHYAEYEKTGDRRQLARYQAHRDRAETMRHRLKKSKKERDEKIDKILKLKGKLGAGENYKAYISSLTDDKIKALHDKLLGPCKEKEVKKSVTSMGHEDGLEINTAEYAAERDRCDQEWLERIFQGMEGYEFGDVPREFSLDKGTLFLSKVDDGVYSGYFRKIEEVEGGQLEENAKVRIERQTLPTLVNFITAKEWILPEGPQENSDDSPMTDQQYQALTAKLSEIEDGVDVMNEQMVPEAPQVETELDKKIRMLELMERLLS